jgi:hypothetical protein
MTIVHVCLGLGSYLLMQLGVPLRLCRLLLSLRLDSRR